MKALSLWQPWASAIAIGEKKIETRHWPTNYRGPLLIHAAKRCPKAEVAEDIESLDLDLSLDTLPLGALIAVARLVDCRSTNGLAICDREAMLGNYSASRFGWMLEDIRAFDPIPYRGAQGLFDVPDDVVAGVIGDMTPTAPLA